MLNVRREASPSMLAWLLVIGLLVVVVALARDAIHWRKEYQGIQAEYQDAVHWHSKYQALQAEYEEAARHWSERIKAAEARLGVQAENSSSSGPSSLPAPHPRQCRRELSQQEYYNRLQQLELSCLEEYQKSEHWQSVKWRYRESDYPQRCLVCGSRDYVLHHRSYARLGEEQLFDLVPLCQMHHEQLHELLDFDPELCVKDTHDYLVVLVAKGQVGREKQRCQDRQFQKILGYKERFHTLPVEAIEDRLRQFGDVLKEEAVIALRELLDERERAAE
jgi:hypothetical protein